MSLNDYRRGAPLGQEAVDKWFDLDGRLVKEAVMRKALFEVGVEPGCRRRIFKFLFGIYPMNSTARDQKTIDIENRANYIALRKRWEVLDKTICFPDEDIANTPWYMDFSDDEEDDSNSSAPLDKNSLNHRHKPTPDNNKPTPKNSKHNTQASGTVTENKHLTETSSDVLSGSCATTTCSSCGKQFQGSEKNLFPAEQNESSEKKEHERCINHECERCRGDVHDGTRYNGNGSHDNSSHRHGDRSNYHGNGYSDGGDVSSSATKSLSLSSECGCIWRRRRSTNGVLDEEGHAVLQILDFPSRVYAARLPLDLDKSYPKAKRTILRDVSRTDRNYHFFSHKRILRKVHRILMIYALFHPDMGYAQGMNDILARFLVVTESEVDSYWLFKAYMGKKKDDFLEDTMLTKVDLVKKLIMEIDNTLYNFFESSECKDYLFCHRWLLLDFKREFALEESIRIFEVLSSHYLELNSDKALVETDKVIAKEFELDGGEMRSKRSLVNLDFTFDLFICVAILTMNSSLICQGTDAASVYGCLNGLSMNLDLNKVLWKAEELFYKYCRLTVTRGFSEVEM